MCLKIPSLSPHLHQQLIRQLRLPRHAAAPAPAGK